MSVTNWFLFVFIISMTRQLIRNAWRPPSRSTFFEKHGIVLILIKELELIIMEVWLFSFVEISWSSEKILAVGCGHPTYNVKAEWLDVNRNMWESLPDYPFGMNFIYSLKIVNICFLNTDKNSVKPDQISVTPQLFIMKDNSIFSEATELVLLLQS